MKSPMFLVAASSVLLVVPALAADISGNWTAEVPGGANYRRDGQPRTMTFVFKVEGEKLTGTCSVFPIEDGVVKGNDLTFSIVANNFESTHIKVLFKGKIVGGQIKMSRTREGAQDPAQAFTVTRAK
jgi:hypothetical protein